MNTLMPNATGWGFLSGTAFMVAAVAVQWLLGSPPGASTAETWGVVAQLLAGLAVALWAWRRGRTVEEVARRSAEDTAGASPSASA